MYNILKDYNQFYLKYILIGVEPVKSTTMLKYINSNPNINIINGYGPTEATICATLYNFTKEESVNYNIIPIGKPLSNNKIFILDKNHYIVPIGTTGEMYIIGDNVGQGYLNNSQLTNERFCQLPFYNSNTAYKTGDLAKWDSKGIITFVGRNDNQIKINGHRIELGEIENTISLYPHIQKCIVLYKNSQLYAYITSDTNINLSDLRLFLQSKLPNFFVPNFMVQIDKFKLTSNGKIDKKYLESILVRPVQNYVAPENEFQKVLIDLWSKFLKVENVGITDNFFELGGDSLVAIQMQIEAFKLGLNISYSDIFQFPTIKQLSEKTNSNLNEQTDLNYDYTQINNLLKNNCPENISSIHSQNISHLSSNILLTGATGFVGSHILANLLNNTKSNIYCIIREKGNISATDRLLNILNFYFGNQYNTLINKRIFIITGDITLKNFGMSEKDYNNLGNIISYVINSAAIVKHYGKSQIFSQTNIDSVKTLIQFCKYFSIRLTHISTTSVSGNIFVEKISEKLIDFSEKDLFINQDLSNIYIYTKFTAEKLILESVLKDTLHAQIIRLGNISSRYSDGMFQFNISENAFVNRLKTFIAIGKFPSEFLQEHLEFTPVDLCAECIVKLALNNTISNKNTIFHIFNNNYILIHDLLLYLKNINIDINIIPLCEFNNVVDSLLKDTTSSSLLSGIITDLDNGKLIYKNKINLDNSYTNSILKTLNFSWPSIDEIYIRKYFGYLKSIKFI